ncbi:DUF1956 domain-containing protein [Salmonella enterica subsp. enterica serovar Virchow]|nr:DUF1956 domain-containing protein [Salmonella enterica subsp. enterica serovar Virchow]MIL09073.1 DUF1956 domain-containing protein [Salmonella enterica subsp. enterica serovar Enteritidis]
MTRKNDNADGAPRVARAAAAREADRAELTRLALVRAALRLFGTVGYDGASTREIATAANANIGSIAYHFGGKEGLRLAVADHIVGLVEGVAAQALAQAPPEPLSPENAEKVIAVMLERMFDFFVLGDEAAEIVPFVLREMGQPSAAFDRIYAGVFEPLHRRFCGVWEAATGEPAESEPTRIAIFALIGQVIYFRLGREAVKRRMGWNALGRPEGAAVMAVLRRNLHATLTERKGAKS